MIKYTLLESFIKFGLILVGQLYGKWARNEHVFQNDTLKLQTPLNHTERMRMFFKTIPLNCRHLLINRESEIWDNNWGFGVLVLLYKKGGNIKKTGYFVKDLKQGRFNRGCHFCKGVLLGIMRNTYLKTQNIKRHVRLHAHTCTQTRTCTLTPDLSGMQ